MTPLYGTAAALITAWRAREGRYATRRYGTSEAELASVRIWRLEEIAALPRPEQARARVEYHVHLPSVR